MAEVTEGYESFVAIVEAGSISGAARALGVPRETVGRRLQRLEDRLGVRLVHRSSRQLDLTPAGTVLFARVRPLVRAAQEADAAVRALDGVPRGLLRVSVPPGAGGLDIAGLAQGFLAAHPEVELEILATTRHVDLIGEGFDVALRAGAVRDPRLVARQLVQTRLVAVAAPAYLARRGTPCSLADLTDHALLLGMEAGASPSRHWPTRGGDPLAVRARLCCNDLVALRQLARAGEGIALLPAGLVRSALDSGALVAVLPDLLGTTASVSVVFVERALMPPKVRAFVDHLIARVPGLLPVAPAPGS